VLPSGFDGAIRQALTDPRVVGGAFSFASDWHTPGMRVVERLANIRSRYLRVPYGDQGLFVRAAAFRTLGGFAEWPIVDDLDLVLRLRKRGKLVSLGPAAVTSARRYREHGVLRTSLVNQAMLAGYALNIDRARLLDWYRRATL
jgi:hypothetical protein